MAIAGLYECFNHWHKQGTVWLYSDPHFNDPDLKAGIERPNAEEMIKMINSKVGRKDTLIILGDICDVECVKKLRGYKVLIAGNHDKGLSNYKRQVFSKKFDKTEYQREEALEEMKRLYPGCHYTIEEDYDFHSPFTFWMVYADNDLFNEVYGGPLCIGEKLILSHEPINIPYMMNIHGHVHSPNHKNDKYHFNVCCDARKDYYPINFNQWMKEGHLASIPSIHRETIDKATQKKKKRGGKKIGEK